MGTTSLREKRLWQAAVTCLVLIYSSLYIARPIAESLRERNLLRAAVGLVFVLAVVAVLLLIRRWDGGWRVYLGLVAAALLYVPVFHFLHLPEERLHYVQYGVFCGLAFAALRERRANRPLPSDTGLGMRLLRAPWFLALILTLIGGWVDEGIQKVLPNRYYDIRDVALNFSAGVLYLIGWRIVQSSRAWEQRATSGSYPGDVDE